MSNPAIKELQVAYAPREQFTSLHNRTQRWACIVAHRRAGKTFACVNEVLTRALYTQKKNARYAYIAPFYRQAKEVAWMYFRDAAAPFAEKITESVLTIELFNGAKIQLFGADNPDALRGLYLDGVVIDEYGDTRPSLWGSVVRPTLSDRKGWAVFIGTPKGENHFYDIHKLASTSPDWLSLTLKASETGILPPEELAELAEQMSEEEYEREMECNFKAAVQGTYYARTITDLERLGRVISLPHDPALPVEAACDLGYTDSTAFWFWQYRPDGVAVIDYYENHSQPLDTYLDMLHDKGYGYSNIWLPHDARAKTLQTGRSTIEQVMYAFRDIPSTAIRIVPRLSLQHGIDAARKMLASCWFDKSRTEDGLEALRAYRRRYDEVRKTFSDQPLHDWSSHGADAFRYFAVVTRDHLIAPVKAAEERKRRATAGFFYTGEVDEQGRMLTNMTINEMWECLPLTTRRI